MIIDLGKLYLDFLMYVIWDLDHQFPQETELFYAGLTALCYLVQNYCLKQLIISLKAYACHPGHASLLIFSPSLSYTFLPALHRNHPIISFA